MIVGTDTQTTVFPTGSVRADAMTAFWYPLQVTGTAEASVSSVIEQRGGGSSAGQYLDQGAETQFCIQHMTILHYTAVRTHTCRCAYMVHITPPLNVQD